MEKEALFENANAIRADVAFRGRIVQLVQQRSQDVLGREPGGGVLEAKARRRLLEAEKLVQDVGVRGHGFGRPEGARVREDQREGQDASGRRVLGVLLGGGREELGELVLLEGLQHVEALLRRELSVLGENEFALNLAVADARVLQREVQLELLEVLLHVVLAEGEGHDGFAALQAVREGGGAAIQLLLIALERIRLLGRERGRERGLLDRLHHPPASRVNLPPRPAKKYKTVFDCFFWKMF